MLADGAAQECLDITDDRIDIEHLRISDLPPGECEQLMRQRRSPLSRRTDLADIAEDCSQSIARAGPAHRSRQ